MDGKIDVALHTQFLGLQDFEVVDVVEDPKQKQRRLVVVPRVALGICPHCRGVSGERHECHEWEVKDLPMGAMTTILQVRFWQFRCEDCDKFFTPHYAMIAPGAHATERLLERMAEMVGFSDVSNAARFFGVAEKTLERWYYEFLERKRRGPAQGGKPVGSLGIDELSLKKSTGNSVAC
jgi:transposase